MTICATCWTDDARATKKECPACYQWRRDHDGQPRPEHVIIRNNERRFEREMLRKNRLC